MFGILTLREAVLILWGFNLMLFLFRAGRHWVEPKVTKTEGYEYLIMAIMYGIMILSVYTGWF